MIRIYLLIQAALMLAFGIYALLDPIALTSSFGLEVGGRHGSYEMRGIYGGVSIGAGLLWLAGAFSRSYVRPALFFIVTYMGGYLIARIAGLFLDSPPEPYFWVFIGYEAFSFITAIMLLRKR